VSRRAFAALAALALAACGEHEFHPPDREQQVQVATGRYHQASFDTIAWPDSAARLFAGNEVYAAHCRRCHGPLGEGATDNAVEQGLDVPSLVRADWPYDSLDAVRERVFAGHPEGMPSWGIGRLTLREIDAVAWYVQNALRAE
jgi:mono/diheme cytochrome c family protein